MHPRRKERQEALSKRRRRDPTPEEIAAKRKKMERQARRYQARAPKTLGTGRLLVPDSHHQNCYVCRGAIRKGTLHYCEQGNRCHHVGRCHHVVLALIEIQQADAGATVVADDERRTMGA